MELAETVANKRKRKVGKGLGKGKGKGEGRVSEVKRKEKTQNQEQREPEGESREVGGIRVDTTSGELIMFSPGQPGETTEIPRNMTDLHKQRVNVLEICHKGRFDPKMAQSVCEREEQFSVGKGDQC